MGTVFLSYSSKNKSVADTLELFFSEKDIILQRDVRDINYKQSIKDFMKKVRDSDYVLLVISKEYLMSVNCMYEVTELIKDDNYRNRILPLVQENTDIFNQLGRNVYIHYWQDEYGKLAADAENLDILNRQDSIAELKKLEEIQRKISEFLEQIADMKILTYKTNITKEDFNKIYYEIDPIKGIVINEPIVEAYYLLNVPRTIKNNKVMIWWDSKNNGYTNNLNNARIFSEEEVYSELKNEWDMRKFSAIPIRLIASKFEQNIIPFTGRFTDLIRQNAKFVIGNKYAYLTEEEVESLI